MPRMRRPKNPTTMANGPKSAEEKDSGHASRHRKASQKYSENAPKPTMSKMSSAATECVFIRFFTSQKTPNVATNNRIIWIMSIMIEMLLMVTQSFDKTWLSLGCDKLFQIPIQHLTHLRGLSSSLQNKIQIIFSVYNCCFSAIL